MVVLSNSDKEKLKEIFKNNLKEPVHLKLFLDFEKNKETSEIAEELVSELMGISDDKIRIEYVDSRSKEGSELLKKLNLYLDKEGDRRGPIFVFEKKPNIVYYGLPAGEEFSVFLEDIISVSKNEVSLPLRAAKKIVNINKPIDVYIFVTPTCPYCPIMTATAHKFAFLNNKIRGIMIDATEFPELSNKFNVYAVPKNIIIYNNEKILEWEGAIPETSFAEYIEKAIERIQK